MAKQIALFNHKGGVSKTTTTFNLGWMLAKKGKKVIIVDCDPQCNLTGMVLGFRKSAEFKEIYEAGGIRNIRDGLAPAFESKPIPIEAVTCEPIKGQRNLFLLPGHIGLAEYEVTLGIAQELSGSLVTLQNLPGSLRHLFNLTADKYAADLLLIDMSPSLGAINQNLLMTSDFFIIPMAPDFFSVMAVDSLASIVPKWASWANQAKQIPTLKHAAYPFPNISPRFLGTIIQRYRLREKKTPSKAFQEWIDELETGIRDRLIPVFAKNDLLLNKSVYDVSGIKRYEALIQMSDFNSLVARSQKYKTPIFSLTGAQLEQGGIVLQRTQKSMELFYDLYSDGADKIVKLIDNANRD